MEKRLKLHQNQAKIWTDKSRFRVLVAGRRFGKSTLAVNELLQNALLHNRSLNWYIAPTYKQAKQIGWRMLKDLVPKELVEKTNESELKIELTNGSLIELKGCDNPDCYDEKTEICTKEGWKLFKDLTYDDKVLTLNPKTQNAEWQKPTDIIIEDYSGDMVRYKHTRADLLVTPNHNFFVEGRTHNKWNNKFSFIKAQDLTSSRRIRRDTGKEGITFKPAYMRFLGIYLAEGSAYGNCGGDIKKRNGNYTINIASFKQHQNEWVEDVLTKCGFNWSRCNSGYRFNKKSEWKKLIKLGNKYTKRIPTWVWKGNKESLEYLFEGMVLGDGWCKDGCYSYSTVSEGLADDFQTLCSLIGKSSNKVLKKQKESNLKDGRKIIPTRDIWIINVHKTKAWYFDNSLNKEFYSGKIYCCSVPNHIVRVRRNGKDIWSGNSLRGVGCSFVVVDEFAVIPNGEALWGEVIRPMLIDTGGRALFIGTPKGLNAFYTIYQKGLAGKDGFKSFRFSSYDNPYLAREEIDLMKDELPARMFQQEVETSFLVSDDNVLIKIEDIEALKGVNFYEDYKIKHISCDPATIGGDECVIYVFENTKIIDEKMLNYDDTQKIASEIVTLGNSYQVRGISIDSVGIGKGVADALSNILRGQDVKVLHISSGSQATDKDRFTNVKTEMWWYLWTEIKNKRIEYPEDLELRRQLSSVEYKVTNNTGKVGLVPKIKTKELLGRSPDRADAYVYGIWGLKHYTPRKEMAYIHRQRKWFSQPTNSYGWEN